MEALGVLRRVEADRVLARARRAEIVGAAADGDDERVVGDLAARDQLLAVELVVRRRELHDLARAVEAVHAPELELEVVPARLREVVEVVLVEVHAAGGDFVQQRLPQVRARAVDERHARAALAAELSPSRVASSSPPAPPPTMTMRCSFANYSALMFASRTTFA